MPDRPVVANNTPLVALWVLDRFDILKDLYGQVLIPEAVYTEFLAAKPTARQKSLNTAPWIKVTPLSNPQRLLAYTGLDQGEAEVLALAKEQKLIDSVAPLLAQLTEAGLFLSPSLVAKALQMANEESP